MKWLITGGSGQLGLALQVELTTRGIEFVSLNSHQLDITKQSEVNAMINSIKPSVIVNAAAWTDVDGAEINQSGAHAVNALGPQNLALAAKEVGSKSIQVSTDYVFSGETTRPWPENSDHNPQSVYGSTKSDGEKLVLGAYPTGSYVIRTAWLYSAEHKNFAKTITKLALNGNGEVRVVNDQIGQPTFTGDLAKQIVDLVLSNAPVGIYHGTSRGKATWFELSHEGWAKTSVAPMRDWRIALAEAMPAIISAVKAEE